jgi:adenosylcobinamide-GDP ribazoletransferase
MHFVAAFTREFLIAIQFFTRIPVTGRLAEWVGFSPALLRASAAHFPAVGAVIGVVAAAVFALTQAVLPDSTFSPFVAAALSTVATALLTGAFHEDGLADVADGLGGGYTRERALEIMKDSRVGAFGALALVLALLSKLALLAILGSVDVVTSPVDLDLAAGQLDNLAPESVFSGALYGAAALALGHVVSRTAPLLLIRLLPYVGDAASNKAKPLAESISAGRLAIGFGWCALAVGAGLFVFDALQLLVACLMAGAALLWMGRLFKRRLQGFTGDCLGATQQVCEIAFYLGLAASL